MTDPFTPAWQLPLLDPTAFTSGGTGLTFAYKTNVWEAGGSSTTLTSTMRRTQVLTLTTTFTAKLPSTGIKAGERVTLVNTAAFLLTVQTSAGNAVESLEIGVIQVMALKDNPTAAADWFVTALEEQGTWTAHMVGPFVTSDYTSYFARSKKNVTLVVGDTGFQTSTSATTLAITGIPSRMTTISNVYNAINVYTGVADILGCFVLSTSNTFTVFAGANGTNFLNSGNQRIRGFSVSYVCT